ncbi:MAG TPA: magnesium/cobalt transporter CorA [Acidimicrobiales bacterium]|nr:magnesium/cobalt transporter CorA [Acidimicrobiales bacterium]
MVNGTLRLDGKDTPATLDNIRAALAGKDFFWLDVEDSSDDDEAQEMLRTEFGFHPLAVQASERFSQRPRLEDYDGFAFLVARGADPEHNGNAEVHCFWNDRYVVTLHHADCKAIRQVRERMERHPLAKDLAEPQIVIVYLVMGVLVDSFFPVLSAFDDSIDKLEDEILVRPTEAQLGELFKMKRDLMDMRRVVAPQRDMMASINSGVSEVPGMTDEAGRYFRDLYDHLIRLADLVDNYRDLLSSAMDTHLSTVSNRLNVVMKQLTIIATIFLPLSFLTGFFGQNFGYLVRVWLAPTWSFYALGIGLDLVAVAFLLVMFRKRGWLGGPTV